MAKYDELSGKGGVYSLTPYGLLVNIIMEHKTPIRLLDCCNSCSIDGGFTWTSLNPGLFKRLWEMAEYCDNILLMKNYDTQLDKSIIFSKEYKQAQEV